jgi:hypothetical protein
MKSAMQPPGAATHEARRPIPTWRTKPARTRTGRHNAIDEVARLHRAIGNHAVHGTLQAGRASFVLSNRTFGGPPGFQLKLDVSSPGDAYEQAADRVAQHIARLPSPVPGTACAVSSATGSCCSACESNEVASTRAKARPTLAPALSTAGGLVEELDAGQPLDSSTRAFFEPIIGVDLRGVRIHADQSSADVAKALNARAFTAGTHVFFAANRYAPVTAPGRALLGHELTHVVQQAAANRGDAVVHTVQRATDQPELQLGIAAGLYEKEHPEDETLLGAWSWTCLSRASPAMALRLFEFRIDRMNATKDPAVKARLWNELVSNIMPGFWTNSVCGCLPPSWMVEIARWWLRDEPDALAHLEHYLEGSGAPYVEEVRRIFAEDPRFKESVEFWIADAGTPSGQLRDVYPSYSTGNWSNSFGGIDLIEYEILPANFSAPDRTALVRVTIEDDYDWHPDEHRKGPCLHTGMEIMKAKGAKAFRQTGTAIVRLKVP